jgi:hypothetical protein
MKSLSRSLSLVLLGSAALLVANTVGRNRAVSAATVAGAYTITFQVKAPTTVPDGAIVTCKARLSPRLTGIESYLASPDPVDSLRGVAKVSGSSAKCTVPFGFAAKALRSGAEMSYEIDAFTAAGPVFLRTQQGIAVAIPPEETTANLQLNVNL